MRRFIAVLIFLSVVACKKEQRDKPNSSKENSTTFEIEKTEKKYESNAKLKVDLGVSFDDHFDGVGLLIKDLNPDDLAKSIGLQKGDIIIQIGDYEIKNRTDYLKALSRFNKGNTTTIIIDRNNKEIETEVTF